MKAYFAAAAVSVVVFLGGCTTAPQAPLSMTEGALTAQSGRVGVVMSTLPKVNTAFPGAGCLLCIAAAEVANSSLTKHTQALTYEDLPKVKEQAAGILRKKGIEVTVIDDKFDLDNLDRFSSQGLNSASKDFRPFSQKFKVDKLIVFSINSIGVARSYSSYIPNGDPKAEIHGFAYMVNLANNTYEWYAKIDAVRASDGNWDEAPTYPGLTNAYYQVIEMTKDQLLKPLAQ